VAVSVRRVRHGGEFGALCVTGGLRG
jgi:hypothetical protein